MSDMAKLDNELAAMTCGYKGEAQKLSTQVSTAVEAANRNAEVVRNFKFDMTSIESAVAAANAAHIIK